MLPTHRSPTHPGEMLLKEFLEPLGVSQVEAAIRQAVTPVTPGTWTTREIAIASTTRSNTRARIIEALRSAVYSVLVT